LKLKGFSFCKPSSCARLRRTLGISVLLRFGIEVSRDHMLRTLSRRTLDRNREGAWTRHPAAVKLKFNIKSLLDGVLMVKTRFAIPWWLGSGTEQCSCCGHTHPYHTQHRCEGCDAVLCSCCASPGYKRPVLCQECKASAKSSKPVRK
jgi:hypothetical protein